jgi:ribose transport system ATP-binding protein
VVALRDGKNAGELPREAIDHDRMVALMVGRQLRAATRHTHAPGEVVLQVRALRTAAFPDVSVSFEVRQREIVGIAGLLGAGRSEILRALVGADPRLAGTVEVAGRAVPGGDPAASARRGLVLVPEDRKVQGLVLGMNVRENLSLPTLRTRGVFVDRAWERELAIRSIRDLGINTPGSEQGVAMLSGGNQQKVVLGKWLACAPQVLLLDEPTRGVDVGARGQLYERLAALAEQGLAVVFVSSDLEEVLSLADRVLVVHEGRIAGELGRDELGERAVMALATGKGVA